MTEDAVNEAVSELERRRAARKEEASKLTHAEMRARRMNFDYLLARIDSDLAMNDSVRLTSDSEVEF